MSVHVKVVSQNHNIKKKNVIQANNEIIILMFIKNKVVYVTYS